MAMKEHVQRVSVKEFGKELSSTATTSQLTQTRGVGLNLNQGLQLRHHVLALNLKSPNHRNATAQ